MTFQLFRIANRQKLKILHVPKLNYCDLRRKTGTIPILTDLLKVWEHYGNIVFVCPAEPAMYYIKDFPIDSMPIGALIPIGQYSMAVDIIDENNRKKPVIVASFVNFFDRL